MNREIIITPGDVQELGDEMWDKDFHPEYHELCKLADIVSRLLEKKLNS